MRRLVGHVCLHFFGFILEFKQFLSVVGDVLIESEVSVVTFFNLNDMSAQEVGLHVCIHRNKCVYMRVCDCLHLYYVWKKTRMHVKGKSNYASWSWTSWVCIMELFSSKRLS